MPSVNLFYLSVYLAKIRLLRHKIFLGKFYHDTDQHTRYRKDYQSDQRHNRADAEHHDQYPYNRRHRCDQLGDALVQALPQGIYVVGNPGKHLAYRPGFKIPERHPVNLHGNLFAETIAKLLGYSRHNQSLYEGKASA